MDDDAEIVVVPLEAQQERVNTQTVDDADGATDTGYNFIPVTSYNPFGGNFKLFDSEFFNLVLITIIDKFNTKWCKGI